MKYKKIKIGINGLGRIGKNILKIFCKESFLEVVHINDLKPIKTIAHLLKYDSTHGVSDMDIDTSGNNLIVNNKKIFVSKEKTPSKIDWAKFGAEIILDCTGRFIDKKSLSKHFKGKVKKVIVSFPCSDADKTIIIGINEDTYNKDKDNIISNSSCTANCLLPVLSILKENFGIDSLSLTNIHPYTIDQNLLDDAHKKNLRLGRAASLSIIPTETGVIKAIYDIMPDMENRITGFSVRVPTPNVSLIDIVLKLKSDGVTASEVNSLFKKESGGKFKNILKYNDKELVSIDFNGLKFSTIFDATLTRTIGSNMLKIAIWHDNEIGYSHRLKELTEIVAKKIK